MAMCDIKLSLIQVLSNAASRHGNLTAIMGARVGKATPKDFRAAKSDCKAAASVYDAARIALDDHCKVHGC
jgi:hypothetical protein